MLFERKRLAVAVACAFGTGMGAAMLPGAASAQTDTAATQGPIKVDVTGTNIRSVEGQTSLPVQVITREEIERVGVQTAAALVDRLSANSTTGGVQIATSEGATGAGHAAA